MELAGPLAVWALAAYRAWCWVSHEEPRAALRWPLSLAALAWLGLLASVTPDKALLGPTVLERLSFGLIPVETPAPPAPPPAPEPAIEPPPAPLPPPQAVAPASPPSTDSGAFHRHKPAQKRRRKKKPAPEPVPDL